jgi:hypothetical protein
MSFIHQVAFFISVTWLIAIGWSGGWVDGGGGGLKLTIRNFILQMSQI